MVCKIILECFPPLVLSTLSYILMQHFQCTIWLDYQKAFQWKGINCKQSTRWQHLSRLKASAFFSLQKILVVKWNRMGFFIFTVENSAGDDSKARPATIGQPQPITGKKSGLYIFNILLFLMVWKIQLVMLFSYESLPILIYSCELTPYPLWRSP